MKKKYLKYKKKYLELKYGGTNHKILGENISDEIIEQAKKIWNSISIINYSDDQDQLNINGITVPHAGFKYSGLHATLSLLQLNECNNEKITIYWFRHGGVNEHSCENIKILYKKLFNKSIESEEVTEDTKLKDSGVIISTDFSHYNYGKTKKLNEVWNSELFGGNNKPCGLKGYDIFKEKFNTKLIAYSTSSNPGNFHFPLLNERFDGVTYGTVMAFENKSWNTILKSKLLAYTHLEWVKEYLLSDTIVINNGLFWSPLKNMKGSCFVTVEINDKTYSCFGSWEDDDLLLSIKKASKTVKTAYWHTNPPVTKKILSKNNYTISITLICPKDQWNLADEKLNNKRGYVFYDKVNIGATYLPSVWESITNQEEFKEHLKTKNMRRDMQLYSYDSITWKY